MAKIHTVLGIPILTGKREELLRAARALLGAGGVVNTPNPEMLSQAMRSEELFTALSRSLNVPDGNYLAATIRKDGAHTDVFPGVDLGEALLERSGVRFAIVGGKPGIAERALARLCQRHPSAVPTFAMEGYSLSQESLEEKLRSHSPDLVFICTGSPRQQILAERLRTKFRSVLFVCLGGSVDVYAGAVGRAPLIFRKMRLEWLYRAIRQPRRIPRLLKSLRFFAYLGKEKSGKLHKSKRNFP